MARETSRPVLPFVPLALLLLCWAGPRAAGQEDVLDERRDKVFRSLSVDQRAEFDRFLEESGKRKKKAERQGLRAFEALLQLRMLPAEPPPKQAEKVMRHREMLKRSLDRAMQAMDDDMRERFMGHFRGMFAEAGPGPGGSAGFEPFEAPPFRAMRPPVEREEEPRPEDAPPEPAPRPERETILGEARKAISAREALGAAEEALRREDFSAAADSAGLAARKEPGLAPAYALRAVALAASANVPEAVSEIENAARLAPADGQILAAKAFVMNKALRSEQAKADADAAIRKGESSPWTWYQLACAQAALGDQRGSLLSLEQAAARSPTDYAGKLQKARRASSEKDILRLCEDSMVRVAVPKPGDRLRRRGAGRRLVLLGSGLLLACVFGGRYLLRRIAAWIVRVGAAPGREPTPAAGPTPLVGLTPPSAVVLPKPGETPAAPVSVPTGYRFLRQIGAGGMGTVYEAEDLSLERKVAIKRMRDEIRLNPGECERFLKEARTVAKLRHPSIVEIFAIMEQEGEILLVFEYLDGAPLDALLRKYQRFSVAQARGVLRQVCAALGYAHERGVIHRDLKPSNIMVTRELLVKVMDFGVARQAKDAVGRLSVTNTVVGTPPYMAPESEVGEVRKESDLYSLGVCLYEMLTGARPFEGTGAGMLLNKRGMVYEPAGKRVQGLPPGVDAFIARALQAEPEKRFHGAAEFLAEFEQSTRGA